MEGLAGPLAGVHAGLEWVKAMRLTWGYVVTVAGDTPFFPSDLVQRFLAELADHPLCSWRRRKKACTRSLAFGLSLWPVSWKIACSKA